MALVVVEEEWMQQALVQVVLPPSFLLQEVGVGELKILLSVLGLLLEQLP